ncbi:hypothetical protein A2U01_0082499, partial [Trifolium medium]|nr:hypothetical protein [Trifolium medium]
PSPSENWRAPGETSQNLSQDLARLSELWRDSASSLSPSKDHPSPSENAHILVLCHRV